MYNLSFLLFFSFTTRQLLSLWVLRTLALLSLSSSALMRPLVRGVLLLGQ